MFVQADDPKRLDAVGEDGHGAAGSHGQLEIEGKIIELHTDRKLRSRLNRRNVVLRALPEEENRAKEILARHTDKD